MSDDIEEMSVAIEEDSPDTDSNLDMTEEKMNLGISWASLFFDYWFLWLIIAVSAVYVYLRYIAPTIEKYMQDLADRKLEAKLHKNPDLVRARQEALMDARRRMQETHDAQAARMAELRKQREEKKKEEMLLKNKGRYANAGHTLNEATDPRKHDNSRPNRTDYNPLMGSGSGGYRPARRSCPGGGCG